METTNITQLFVRKLYNLSFNCIIMSYILRYVVERRKKSDCNQMNTSTNDYDQPILP